MKKLPNTLFALIVSPLLLQTGFAQVQSPAEYLGYELGDRFTPHHQVLNYVSHVAEKSDWVSLEHYGKTNEMRELVYLVITRPENHQNLEEIRQNNLKLTGLMNGSSTENKKAIVWLSYNVHGNEASCTEAAMKTLYEFAQPGMNEAKQWLDNTVVIMDPLLNPDGRDRYVNWYNQMMGVDYDPKFFAREHHEPWPGGRSNHYYFDLNRDWAWLTQVESQQRTKIYQQWMPHVHVDFHEQGYNSPYYFAPAAEPFHKAITSWQREFQTTIGKNHLNYFDEEGWLYFTRERFDLFYPSYGDTWPTYNGAIGMTYEQAGHGLAGLGIHKQEGDTLTLTERLTHHHFAGLSTVEVTSENAERVIQEFDNHFNKAVSDPAGTYKSYIVKAENHPDKIYDFLNFLDTQQIRYGKAGDSRNIDAYDYATGVTSRVSVQEDDIVISSFQPQSQLVRTLFEPQPELSDSVTYDITSWEMHYRYGLDGYASTSRLDAGQSISKEDFRTYSVDGADNAFAYVVNWESMDDARFLSEITKKGIKSRFSEIPFVVNGREFPHGSLVITRDNNRHLGSNFHEIIRSAAENHAREVYASPTGFVDSGSDFGSANVRYIEKPNVAIITGDGTSSLNAGEIWHYFDHQLQYPATLLHSHQVMRADLSDFNVLILPSGSYRQVFGDTEISKLSEWVRDGGTLISIGQANSLIAGRNGFQIELKTSDADEPEDEDKLQPYGNRERRSISNITAGAIYDVRIDNTHPLGFGYNKNYYSLKRSAMAFNYLDSGWNVGSIQAGAHRSGFVGANAQKNLEDTLVFGVQSHGSGNVVYMVDNPLFRAFWENGKLFVANAVFFVGN